MNKLEAQYLDLKKALKKLEAALKKPESEINRDATIKRFEFTFEMSWKLMQSIAKENNINVYGVKTIIREAAKLGLIAETQTWFEFLNMRNITAHTYKQKLAKKVYAAAKKFPVHVLALLDTSKSHLDL